MPVFGSSGGKRVPLPVFAGIALFILVVPQLSHLLPSARRSRAAYEALTPAAVASVTLEPADDRSAIAASVTVTDSAGIAELVHALTNLPPHENQHPHMTMAVLVRFHLRSGQEVGGHLFATSNDGTIFTVSSDIDKGWVLGNYAVPMGPAVFDLIAKWAAQP
jgi:hypothetical protein